MNIGAPGPDLAEAEPRVLGMQTKLHHWATTDPGRQLDDLYNLVSDPAFLVVAWNRVRGNTDARSARPCPVIVDEGTWNAAQLQLTRNRTRGKTGSERFYLLRGVIKCGNCDAHMVGWAHSPKDSGRLYYHCVSQIRSYWKPGYPRCEAKLVPARQVEASVWERCRRIILHPDMALVEAQQQVQEHLASLKDTTAERETLLRQIAEKSAQRERQMGMYRRRSASFKDTERIVKELEREIASLEGDLRSLDVELEIVRSGEATLKKWEGTLAPLAAQLDAIEQDPEARRRGVRLLEVRVTATTSGQDRGKKVRLELSLPLVGHSIPLELGR